MDSRTNWRVIDADGVAHRLTRDGAAYYLRIGRQQGRNWIKTAEGWKC